MEKLFFAVYDPYTRNGGSGFGNTKFAVAFKSKAARDQFVEESECNYCHAISRREASKITISRWHQNNDGNNPFGFSGRAVVLSPSYGEDEALYDYDVVIDWPSQYQPKLFD